MHITKIQQSDDGLSVSFRENTGEESGFKGETSTKKEPTPEFSEAFRALRPIIRDVNGFPHDWATDLILRAIIFRERHDGRRQARIYADRVSQHVAVGRSAKLIETKTPWIFISGNDTNYMLHRQGIEAIEVLEDEAVNYVKGSRAQQTMSFEEEKQEATSLI